MTRTARSKYADDKTVRIKPGPGKRARIAALESGKTMGVWLAEAIAVKADVQEQQGKLTKLGARVASEAVVRPIIEEQP